MDDLSKDDSQNQDLENRSSQNVFEITPDLDIAPLKDAADLAPEPEPETASAQIQASMPRPAPMPQPVPMAEPAPMPKPAIASAPIPAPAPIIPMSPKPPEPALIPPEKPAAPMPPEKPAAPMPAPEPAPLPRPAPVPESRVENEVPREELLSSILKDADKPAAQPPAASMPASPTKTIRFANAGEPDKPPSGDLQQDIADILPTKQPASPIKRPASVGSSSVLKPLRTFEGDVAEAIAHRQISSASMVIAEKEKGRPAPSIPQKPAQAEAGSSLSPSEPSAASSILSAAMSPVSPEPAAEQTSAGSGRKMANFLIIAASLVLVAGGAYAAYYLYSVSPLSQALSKSPVPTPTQQVIPSLIPADSQTVVAIDGLSGQPLLDKLYAVAAKPQSPGAVREIIPTMSQNGQVVRVSSTDMIGRLGLQPPDILTRSLEQPWMLGVFAGPDGQDSPFVVLQNDFFQNAFAGMLQWESAMPDQLSPILNYGSTTASSAYSEKGKWVDRIISNKDVREFVDPSGNVLFLYSFIDNTHLVIAGSEADLAEIVSRLEKQDFVR